MAKQDQPLLHKRLQCIFCHAKPKKSATSQTAKKLDTTQSRPACRLCPW